MKQVFCFDGSDCPALACERNAKTEISLMFMPRKAAERGL